MATDDHLDSKRLTFALKPIIKPPSNRIPFGLGKKDDDTPIIPKPVEPPKPKNPYGRLVAGCLTAHNTQTSTLGACMTDTTAPALAWACLSDYPPILASVANCLVPFTAPFFNLANCANTAIGTTQGLANCGRIWQYFGKSLHACQFAPVVQTVQFGGCVLVWQPTKHHYHACTTPQVSDTTPYANCAKSYNHSQFWHTCQAVVTPFAVIVPCRFYPIPEPPPPPIVGICRVRPPSNRLNFGLAKRQRFESNALPFALACWHDTPPPTTPNKGTYIVHNTITATIAGIVIEPLAFSIKTDMDSFCWSGQLEIPTKDYHKIKAKLDTQRGEEPLISVTINGHTFTIIAEEVSKNRSFVNHTYDISGRSITARASLDYANVVKMDNDLYASQIVNDSLRDLPIVADFGVDDWRTHATFADTPIAIIDTVATACGGFVMSDKADSKLYLRPRYKVPAWELATTTPDRVIPLDVIKSISEQKRTNPRYNAVWLTDNKQNAKVYREREGQDKFAPVQQNALYSDQACIIPAGIAILSDSGTHQTANITMRWADKYNLTLAELGQIWQINDKIGNADDAWRGIVKSVSIDVKIEDGVPTVWQTVEIDRYLDL